MQKQYDLIKFTDNDFELDVRADKENEMATLFNVTLDNISFHIKNIFKEQELDLSTAEESSVVQKEEIRVVKRQIKIYNLDMIISVGYRVKSKRGIIFRKWANKVLKAKKL